MVEGVNGLLSARTATVRVSVGRDRYDVRGSYWLILLRWRWAMKRGKLLRLVCADGKVRWFNARQIAWMAEL